MGWDQFGEDEAGRRRGRRAIGVLLGVLVAVSVFFYPVWTGMQVPYGFWQAHMWLDTWR